MRDLQKNAVTNTATASKISRGDMGSLENLTIGKTK